LESARGGGGIKKKRLEAVMSHYLAIRTSWCLVHGEPRARGGRNTKKISGFIGHVTQLIREGPKANSQWSHLVRQKALLKTNNDRGARREFLASTMARSIFFKVPKAVLDASVESAIGRWMSKRAVDESMYQDLERYIDWLPLKPFQEGEIPEWPIPNDHACLTHTIKEGGTAVALVEAETRIKLARLDFLFTGIQVPTYREKLTGIFPADAVEDLFNDFDDVADVLEGSGSLPDGPTIVGEYLDRVEPALRPHPISEMGGKVRVVTLHPAEEIHAARRLTSLWLNRLTSLISSRAMLKNEEVVIEREREGAELYSADLKSATDYIDHRLAQHVAYLLCKKLHRDGDIPIVLKLFGSKVLPDGSATQSGIHMGLGPTWVILSLLNGFAAWKAGVSSRTYRICGDDLIGYWHIETVRRYESNLEGLGLVVNKKKAFFGRRGVFCERIVEKDGERARALDVGHLSALTAAKLTARFSRNSLAVADTLRDNRVLRHVSDLVRQRLVPSKLGGGRVRHGGSGFGHLSDNGLIFALKRRPQLVVENALPEGVSKMISENSSKVQQSGSIAVSDFLITLKTALQARAYLDGKKLETRPLTKAEFLKLAAPNKRNHKMSRKEDLIKATKGSPLNSATKKTIIRLLTGKIRSSETRIRSRLETLISRPVAESYISPELANSIILMHTHLSFEERLKNKKRVHLPRIPSSDPPEANTLLLVSKTQAH